MTASPRTSITDRLCSVVAAREEQDPIGSVSQAEALLFVEVPTPWGDAFYDANPEGTIYQRIRSVQAEYFERQRAHHDAPGPSLGYRGVYGIAPDPEWSPAGSRRAILVRRPPGLFAHYETVEFRFDVDSTAIVDLVAEYLHDPHHLDAFDGWRTGEPLPRQLFVCTHGHVDICCARFGVPLYRDARAATPAQAHRTAHFGGHRFAPTMKDFPTGYTWGFLDSETTRQVIERTGPIDAIAAKMRGWCGVEGPVQPLDRAGFLRYGWRWMDFPRGGEVLSGDYDNGAWQVRLTYRADDGCLRVLEGEVQRVRKVTRAGFVAPIGARRTTRAPSTGSRA